MKIIPIITAVLVLVALYGVVFDRERLMALVASPDAEVEEIVETDATVEEAEVVEDTQTATGIRVVGLHSVAQNVDDAVVLRGRTEAARQVTVAAETSGLVISEPLRKGAFVEAGDTMCQLDPGTREASLAEARARLAEARGRIPEANAAIAEANARLREANINVDNARRLSERGVTSETQLVSAEAVAEAATAGLQRAQSSVGSAEAGIEAAQAGVAAAEREIGRLLIKAPFSGLLETDTAELGTLMQPGAACATIIQLDPIKLVGFVPEVDVGKIHVGAFAGAKLASGPDVVGEVTFLSRSADPTTRTFRVDVTVANPDLTIGDGQSVEILVAADGRQAHLVPQSALTLSNDGALGLQTITDENTALFMPVTLLRDTAEGVWVTDLPDAVNLITVGQEFVIDGVTVIPTYAEAEG